MPLDEYVLFGDHGRLSIVELILVLRSILFHCRSVLLVTSSFAQSDSVKVS